MKRKKTLPVIAVLVLLAGLAVLLFPHGQELYYKSQTARIKKEFLQDSKEVDYGALYQLLKKENERLFAQGQAGLSDAFSYEQPAVDLSAYGVKDNCIGFISIPCLKVEMPIYLGASTESMRKGVAHLTQTSYPIGGENTNCVIAGHRGQTVIKFRYIHKINIGDEIIITNFKETLTYRAAKIKIIEPDAINEILIQEGKDMVTLFSCHPLGYNYQRYVLYCERV